MSSWLKAAEDLLEVVDRRAKLVAGEVGEDSPSVALHEPSSQNNRKKERPKARKKIATNNSAFVFVDKGEAETFLNQASDKAIARQEESSSRFSISKENSDNVGRDFLSIYYQDSLQPEVGEALENVEVPRTVSILKEKDNTLSQSIPVVNIGDSNETVMQRSEVGQLPKATESYEKIVEDKLAHQENKLSLDGNSVSKDATLAAGAFVSKKLEESKTDVQEQMEEAQTLLKFTNSIGQSKEARLARICNNLSNRLQEYKSENAQLEKLLASEKQLVKSYEVRIEQLMQDSSRTKDELARVESNMLEALATKNVEIETLINASDILKKKLVDSEGSLASLQANMESIVRNRELTETRIVQALREELSSAERRTEEERAAHSSSKMASREREAELEYRAVEASSALAKIQRIAEERTAKAAELEQKLALLEVECASLNQELQDMEARARRDQKKAQDDTSQSLQMQQMQAWQDEVERARQSQRDSENKLSILEPEVQKLRIEIAAMKRDAEHYSRQEHIELEKRFRELTDLLYHKQTQVQTLASEKAAVEFQLEKEMKKLHEAQVEAERMKGSRRSAWDEETEMKALDSLPVYHHHLVGASVQLQKAVKMLDSGAARVTRFLWLYPTARLVLLFYLVFVHLFLMYLLHRLQVQADLGQSSHSIP